MKKLKVGQSKTTFRVIRNIRRKVRVTKLGRKRYRVKVFSRMTKARKRRTAYYGYGDKPSNKSYRADRRRFYPAESWERRHRKYPITLRKKKKR